MSIDPQVELLFDPGSLSSHAGLRLEARTTEDVISGALLSYRAFVIKELRSQIPLMKVINPVTINYAIDGIWELFMPSIGRIAVPYFARTYRQAFLAVDAGDVPEELLVSLADNYAKKMGEYYHSTSREAMIGGFNTYVNRRVPPRVAAEKVLDGYGLTARQMSGMTSATFEAEKIASSSPMAIKSRMMGYISRSLKERLDTFGRQEQHNLEQQAKQTAWLWMIEKGQLPERAEKMWLTAKDEKVCKICGPLHGKIVPVAEKFQTADGALWVPGAHVNCRCELRLLARRFSLVEDEEIGKAFEFEEEEHPRDEEGRFSVKRRTTKEPLPPDPLPFKEPPNLEQFQAFLDTPAPAGIKPLPVTPSALSPLPAAPVGALSPIPPPVVVQPLTIAPLKVQPIVQTVAPLVPTALQPLPMPGTDLGPDTSIPEGRPDPRMHDEPLTVPTEQPIYAVVNRGALDEYYQFENEKFHTSPTAAREKAAEILKDTHEKLMERAPKIGQTRDIKVMPTKRGKYTAHINRDNYERVLEAAQLVSAYPNNEDFHVNSISVKATGPDGRPTNLNIHPMDIAYEFGIDPHDFDVSVVMASKIYTSDDPQVSAHPHRMEEYVVSGKYRSEIEHAPEWKSGVPIRVVEIEPDSPDIGRVTSYDPDL